MSEHPGLSNEFVLDLQQLIDECVFGVATSEQVELLNRLLIENVAARKFYVQSVATLCSLRKWGEYPLSGAGGDGPDQSCARRRGKMFRRLIITRPLPVPMNSPPNLPSWASWEGWSITSTIRGG